MRNWIVAVVLIVAFAIPAVAVAHQGHIHKILGTVASVLGGHVEVKTTDGKVVAVMLDATTAITRGKAKADVSALKVGERVSVDYMQDNKKMNMAKAIKLADAPVAAKK
jgi:hypothetical protein